MGFFKNLGKKIGGAVNKGTQSAQDKIKNIQNNINKQIAKVKLGVNDAPFRVLLPFHFAMKNALTRKGIATNGTLKDVSIKFYRYVVIPSKGKNFYSNVLNGGKMMLNEEDAFELYDENRTFEMNGEYTEEGSEAESYEKAAKETKGIIQKIIEWFKERKAKKNQGQALTNDELATLGDAQNVSDAMYAQAEADEDGVRILGIKVMDIVYTLITVVLLYYGITYFFGKKKTA